MRFSFALGFAIAVLGCSGGSSTETADTGTDTGAPLCATDPRVQAFSLGITAKTPSGVQVKITAADPAAPAKGLNAWTIAVADASGAALDGATIAVKPFMPDHGHPASVTPTVTAKGGGQYQVGNVSLFMPGVWQITFGITLAGKPAEDAMFTFCIAE